MGLWWKKVNYKVNGGIFVAGLEGSFSKTLPIIWRFQNPWIVFRVQNNSVPYWLYFNEIQNGLIMRFRKKIKTENFVARIGSEDLVFFATVSRINLFESLEIEMVSNPLDYSAVKKLKNVTIV